MSRYNAGSNISTCFAIEADPHDGVGPRSAYGFGTREAAEREYARVKALGRNPKLYTTKDVAGHWGLGRLIK